MPKLRGIFFHTSLDMDVHEVPAIGSPEAECGTAAVGVDTHLNAREGDAGRTRLPAVATGWRIA